MQTVSADVKHEAGSSEPPSTAGGDRLIKNPGPCERNQNDEERHV